MKYNITLVALFFYLAFSMLPCKSFAEDDKDYKQLYSNAKLSFDNKKYGSALKYFTQYKIYQKDYLNENPNIKKSIDERIDICEDTIEKALSYYQGKIDVSSADENSDSYFGGSNVGIVKFRGAGSIVNTVKGTPK